MQRGTDLRRKDMATDSLCKLVFQFCLSGHLANTPKIKNKENKKEIYIKEFRNLSGVPWPIETLDDTQTFC